MSLQYWHYDAEEKRIARLRAILFFFYRTLYSVSIISSIYGFVALQHHAEKNVDTILDLITTALSVS